MRLILLLCSLICYGMASPVLAGPLADRLAGELVKQAPEQALPLDEVQRLDRRLITPDSLHPAWQRYPLRQLQAIYRYQQECGTENELPAEWLPLLRRLLVEVPGPTATRNHARYRAAAIRKRAIITLGQCQSKALPQRGIGGGRQAGTYAQ